MNGEGDRRTAERPADSQRVSSDQHDADAGSVAEFELARRRRSARRAAARTWHHLHDRGLVCELVERTLVEIVREAG